MARPSNISPGGQVYDRTTGTWAGPNLGTIGGGYTGDGVGKGSVVIHDANGPVGVHFVTRELPSGPAAAVTSNGVRQAGPSPAAGVTGPGAPAVAAGPSLPRAAATAGNRGVFREQQPVVLGMDAATPVMPINVAGQRVAHDMGWSNAADAEERWGESELLSPTWFYSWGVAGADAWANASVSNGGPLRTERIQGDLWNLPGVVRQGAISLASHLDAERARASLQRHVDEQMRLQSSRALIENWSAPVVTDTQVNNHNLWMRSLGF